MPGGRRRGWRIRVAASTSRSSHGGGGGSHGVGADRREDGRGAAPLPGLPPPPKPPCSRYGLHRLCAGFPSPRGIHLSASVAYRERHIRRLRVESRGSARLTPTALAPVLRQRQRRALLLVGCLTGCSLASTWTPTVPGEEESSRSGLGDDAVSATTRCCSPIFSSLTKSSAAQRRGKHSRLLCSLNVFAAPLLPRRCSHPPQQLTDTVIGSVFVLLAAGEEGGGGVQHGAPLHSHAQR